MMRVDACNGEASVTSMISHGLRLQVAALVTIVVAESIKDRLNVVYLYRRLLLADGAEVVLACEDFLSIACTHSSPLLFQESEYGLVNDSRNTFAVVPQAQVMLSVQGLHKKLLLFCVL